MNANTLAARANALRQTIVKMVYHAGSGHLGGSLSAVEILTVLYFREMRLEPDNPQCPQRDRFVLSKGHITPAYYATLAMRGFFPKDLLGTFRRLGSALQGHPDRKRVPGVDMSTGSLGQGLSVAVGMALAAKLKGENYRTYALLGDGELQEGQVWEAFMLSAQYRLDNLCVIIDQNGIQSDGRVNDINSIDPLDAKLRSFRFHVLAVDGHNLEALSNAFAQARKMKGKPTAILAQTVKGKGVSFMEGNAAWHGRVPDSSEYAQAMAELKRAGAAL